MDKEPPFLSFMQAPKWAQLTVAVIVLVIAFAVIGGLSNVQKSISGASEDGNKTVSEASPSPQSLPSPTPKELSYEALGSYKVGTETWGSIVISSDATKEEVIKLAKELHEKNPNTHFDIFDDKTELKAIEKWHIFGDKVYYPEDWYFKHEVGMVNEMLTKEGLKWQFYSDSSKYLSSENLDQ